MAGDPRGGTRPDDRVHPRHQRTSRYAGMGAGAYPGRDVIAAISWTLTLAAIAITIISRWW